MCISTFSQRCGMIEWWYLLEKQPTFYKGNKLISWEQDNVLPIKLNYSDNISKLIINTPNN